MDTITHMSISDLGPSFRTLATANPAKVWPRAMAILPLLYIVWKGSKKLQKDLKLPFPWIQVLHVSDVPDVRLISQRPRNQPSTILPTWQIVVGSNIFSRNHISGPTKYQELLQVKEECQVLPERIVGSAYLPGDCDLGISLLF